MRIGDFFSNASVAAFVGAFAAFILVAANDWRRRRRKKKLLTFLIDDSASLARDKRQTVEEKIELIQDNRYTDAPIMRFQTVALSNHHQEVMDMLDANENQGLSALIYWMESIDGLLDEARQSAQLLRHLEESGAPHEQKSVVGARIMSLFKDADANLRIFDRLCGYYVSGQPHKIQELIHPIGEGNDRKKKVSGLFFLGRSSLAVRRQSTSDVAFQSASKAVGARNQDHSVDTGRWIGNHRISALRRKINLTPFAYICRSVTANV